MHEKYLSTKEFCEILNISHSTIYRMIRDKSIPAVKIGRHWKIPEGILLKYQSRYNHLM